MFQIFMMEKYSEMIDTIIKMADSFFILKPELGNYYHIELN